MDRTIRIIVAGKAGVGKSTLVQLLQDALKSAGLNSQVTISTSGSVFENKKNQERRLKAISEAKIEIEERHTYSTTDGFDSIFGIK